ncbi:DUF1918 domain-containing protein [Paractinoplanes brasiliensis]|uniref:Uncharacterized protein DUF1918 n=1 Tax=Paractinoplanes brasiliensis TaxID=52695 RepID=A0A4R6JKC9_9ACTN|nr:DUF1918 domain-containing protein [Actinoplanes brasiliensis]TDO36713.1 uncharacterized protein DUF1918 [Actinoplanes brasiliensis]GID32350.1 hypothetical protein Abr02nite_73330 [Actinoplanes brasiliensis]
MRAQIGDRLVLEGTHLGDARRVGIVIAVAHDDGSPPYEVRWLDTGRATLIFPGPEARIESQPPVADVSGPA